MARIALVAGVLVAALAGGGAAAVVLAANASAASPQTAPVPPTVTPPTTPTTPVPPLTPLRVTLDACRAGQVDVDRSATFTGSMPMIKGAMRMRMRFDLYTRRDALSSWRRIVAPKWGVWHVSKPRVPGFVFTKLINGLAAPASYRAVVSYRWFDAESQQIRSTQRKSTVCTQTGPL